MFLKLKFFIPLLLIFVAHFLLTQQVHHEWVIWVGWRLHRTSSTSKLIRSIVLRSNSGQLLSFGCHILLLFRRDLRNSGLGRSLHQQAGCHHRFLLNRIGWIIVFQTCSNLVTSELWREQLLLKVRKYWVFKICKYLHDLSIRESTLFQEDNRSGSQAMVRVVRQS